ncbi:MAG: hypothetical protein IJA69_01730 [Clostridia bacterium]|nr:hypothetical protein [Clostridia bacterium]
MKKKLLMLVLSCVMALSVVAVGVYALTTVNLGINGSISFIAYDKQVYIEDISLKNLVEETDKGYKVTDKTYEEFQNVYLKNSNSTLSLSGKVLQGETLEVDITLKNLKSNYLKSSLSYTSLPEGVLVRSTGLVLPKNIGESIDTADAKTLKVYISNYSDSIYSLDLSSINLKIAFTEQESLIQTGTRLEGTDSDGDGVVESYEITYHYVEMGTLPATTAVDGVYTEHNIKWRYISQNGTSSYTSETAPTTTSGYYIIESDVMSLTKNNNLLRDDSSWGGLLCMTYDKWGDGNYSLKNPNVYANDYAYSDIRQYMKGTNVYKGSNDSSQYSNIFKDFCIDVDNDLVYNKIIRRTLTDLYTDFSQYPNGDAVDLSTYAPEQGYDMTQSDAFWLISYQEALTMLCGGTWNNAKANWEVVEESSNDFWILRNPNPDLEGWGKGTRVCFINSIGEFSLMMDGFVIDSALCRPCFRLS